MIRGGAFWLWGKLLEVEKAEKLSLGTSRQFGELVPRAGIYPHDRRGLIRADHYKKFRFPE